MARTHFRITLTGTGTDERVRFFVDHTETDEPNYSARYKREFGSYPQIPTSDEIKVARASTTDGPHNAPRNMGVNHRPPHDDELAAHRREVAEREVEERAKHAPRDADGLRTDGPTMEEWVKAGYPADKYPPRDYAVKDSQMLHDYRAEQAKHAIASQTTDEAGDKLPPEPADPTQADGITTIPIDDADAEDDKAEPGKV